MSTVRVADVALDPRTGGLEALYTYQADPGQAIGDAVFVPLGDRPALGFVTAVYEATEEDLGFPFHALRPIIGPVEGLSLPAAVVDLARYVAADTLSPLPVALAPAMPPGVRERLVTAWTLCSPSQAAPSPLERAVQVLEGDLFREPLVLPSAGRRARGADAAHELTPLQKEVLRALQDAGGTLVEAKGRPLEAKFVRALRLLRGKGLVRQSLRIAPVQEKRAGSPVFRLTADTKKVDRFLSREGKRKPAQALTLMRLQTADSTRLTAAEIKAMAGVTEATVRALLDAGLLERIEGEAAPAKSPPTPNAAQRLAIESVIDSVRARETRPFLLFGVTGSGKTEVYLRAAAEALREGRQVLYLVPEIALAAQAIAGLRERFGRSVAVLHSDLPAGERLQNWLRVRDGEASVVLGARSALFAPLSNLGLVIVDEEHETSYKQETAPRYHAKRAALFLGERHRCPVILGSATPSVESFYAAEEGELELLSLPERAASAALPTVEIHDLTEGYRAGQPSILTEDLQARLTETLKRGEQAILFLNRRAYAPFVICRDCGRRMECPHCAVSLSYHRRDRRLRCHHCGFATLPPDVCPHCRGLRLSPFGVGTEKVEEAVAEAFPQAKVARLDRDVAKRKGFLEETLAAFRAGDIQVLVGTQMVAKGLDFPNVTLVGVIAADVSLNLPDFRASERTFALLSQVAGRAGRGRAAGSVTVQTFNPTHPAVVAAQTHDFPAFYETLLAERRAASYPPFRRLVNVILSGENHTAVIQAAAAAGERLRAVPGLEVLGPVDCAVERLQNRWRRHLLLKLPAGASARSVGEALEGLSPRGIQLAIDVDPYSLM